MSCAGAYCVHPGSKPGVNVMKRMTAVFTAWCADRMGGPSLWGACTAWMNTVDRFVTWP